MVFVIKVGSKSFVYAAQKAQFEISIRRMETANIEIELGGV